MPFEDNTFFGTAPVYQYGYDYNTTGSATQVTFPIQVSVPQQWPQPQPAAVPEEPKELTAMEWLHEQVEEIRELTRAA